MADPVLTRDPMTMEEVYTQGKLSGIRMNLTYRHEDNTITVQEVWNLPVEEQLWAEEWQASKRTLGPGFVSRAAADTNIEFKVLQAVQDYIASLPA